MSKEWILNSAMNRFQLNYKRNVGAVSEAIRQCAPKSKAEWEQYYFSNIRPKEHIIELGKKLYVKITEVIRAEVDAVTEEDCIDYLLKMVIDRTYEGYLTEIQTVYGQVQNFLRKKFPEIEVKPAPDEWDRRYNVDFFIEINGKYIGLQIKPVSNTAQIPTIYSQRAYQEKSHKEFTKEFCGKVFYVFSTKVNGKKRIANMEVIDEIIREIERLKKDSQKSSKD